MTGKCILAIVLLVGTSSAQAQDWAKKMFESTSHSFGAVARGAKAEFAFKFKNIYKEDVHVTGVRSSCGCTTPKFGQHSLKTYEEGEIVALFNTAGFVGDKTATLTVTFDKPFFAEVQLQVSGYIRSDVVLNPGTVDFASVDHGTGAEKKIAITYAGRDNWQIKDVLSANAYLEAELNEASRGNGQVAYSLLVRLKDNAPVGYLKDQITLVTNDAKASQITVDIEGRVVSEVTVSPTSLFLGVVQPGQKKTKQLILKGKKPFRIMDVSCDDNSFQFEVPDASKTAHVVNVNFTAGDKPGKVAQKIRITTDLGEAAAPEVSAYAEVVKGSE